MPELPALIVGAPANFAANGWYIKISLFVFFTLLQTTYEKTYSCIVSVSLNVCRSVAECEWVIRGGGDVFASRSWPAASASA